MNKIRKRRPFIKFLIRISIIAGIIFVLLVGISWFIFEQKKELISETVVAYFNDNYAGQIQIQDLDFLALKFFPRVGVSVKGLELFETKKTVGSQGDTALLVLGRLDGSIDLWSLISKSKLKVDRVNVEQGSIWVNQYVDSSSNLANALKQTSPQVAADVESSSELSLDLQIDKIQVKNFILNLGRNDRSGISQFKVYELDAGIGYEDEVISCKLQSTQEIPELYLDEIKVPKLGSFSTNIDLTYQLKEQYLQLDTGTLEFDHLAISVFGKYIHGQNGFVDINFDGSTDDIGIFSKIITDQFSALNTGAIDKGDVYIRGKMKGPLALDSTKLEMEFGINDVDLVLPDDMGTFENVGFQARLSTGESDNYADSYLSIKDIRGQLPGGSIVGEILVSNFLRPAIEYDVKASLDLDGLDEVFRLKTIDNLSGQLSLDLKFDGLLDMDDYHQMDDLASSTIELGNISFDVPGVGKRISDLSGRFTEEQNVINIKDFSLDYDGSDVRINGQVENLLYFIWQQEEKLNVDLKVQSNNIYTKHFISDTTRTAKIDDQLKDLYLELSIFSSGERGVDQALSVEIPKLSFNPEKLAAVQDLRVKSDIRFTDSSIKVNLPEVHIELPTGSLDLSGSLLSNKDSLLDIKVDLKTKELPIDYLDDLFTELNDDKELIVEEKIIDSLYLLTTDLDLSTVLGVKPFSVPSVNVKKSSVLLSRGDSTLLDIRDFNTNVENFTFMRNPGEKKIRGIQSLSGNLDVERFYLPSIDAISVGVRAEAENDIFDINFDLAADFFSSSDNSLMVDLSGEEGALGLKFSTNDLKIEDFTRPFQEPRLASGVVDLTVDLQTKGNTSKEYINNLSGSVMAHGEDLIIYGVDMDKILEAYERSQRFNLVDLSAVMLAGPLGAVVTKGSNFTKVLSSKLVVTDSTALPELMSHWEFDAGSLKTDDVAFSTLNNRVSFDGTFDYVNDTIPGFTVYVLDKNSCALLNQGFYGSSSKIEVGKVKVAKVLLGSVINLLNAVVGKDCQPVYSGSVKHPEKKKRRKKNNTS